MSLADNPRPKNPSKSLKLWYDKPAEEDWNRALPIGNGKLGAMVFGNVVTERIQLNEDTLWHGGPRDRNNPDTLKSLPEIRKLLRESRLGEAHAIANDALSGVPDIMRNYEPLTDLLIRFELRGVPNIISQAALDTSDGIAAHGVDSLKPSAYRRELDLATAKIKVEFTLDGITYTREHLASAVENVVAIRFAASEPGAISFRLRMERGPRNVYSSRYADTVRAVDPQSLLMLGRAGGEKGVRFAACLRAASEGGRISVIGETLVVNQADSVTLVLASATSFREADPATYATERSRAAIGKSWASIVTDHEREHSGYFDRMDLMLGDAKAADAAENIPTDARLQRVAKGENDPALAALYFQFGRYLLISSSRPGSLPANGQGIWNQEFMPAWGSKYTININVQMNYWPAEMCNLADCHQPLFDHMERLVETGTKTAQVMYGCRGFVVHHNTDLWADSCPTDRNLAASYWYLGGAWLALHLWEHYDFGRDSAFLPKAYAVMKAASQFFLDHLIPDAKGRLVISPSCSPENVYRLPNGEAGTLCEGCSMDSQILEMLFLRTRDAAALLGTDEAFQGELESARQRLPQPTIGKRGQLMEWPEDHDEIDPQHRHVSHAFALFPGDMVSPSKTPTLAEAIKVTLKTRGNEGTGWCMAWKSCLWARLGDGETAHRLLMNLLLPVWDLPVEEGKINYEDGGSYPNLFCAHPPFQIDGNFGGTAAITEMLLQSHEVEEDPETKAGLPVIHLLPALPGAWKEGSVRGLRARGGFEVDISWAGGVVTECLVGSVRGGSCFIRYSDTLRRIDVGAGRTLLLKFDEGVPVLTNPN